MVSVTNQVCKVEVSKENLSVQVRQMVACMHMKVKMSCHDPTVSGKAAAFPEPLSWGGESQPQSFLCLRGGFWRPAQPRGRGEIF